MRLELALAFTVASLASCGPTTKDSAANDSAITSFTLTSSAFRDGQAIPAEFTCDGAGVAPPLSWGKPPAGTKSFALVVDDPDAPGDTFRHWGVADIPATARSLQSAGFVGVENDFGKPGYGGPCPPKGHGPHHYHFKLFALDVGTLGLKPEAKVADVEREAGAHMVGRGELVGTYERR